VLRAFEEAGLRSDRIIFSEREPTRELHLGRLKGVDVFLDTFPYNAHSLAADALSAGVPLVTRAGASYASRVAGSLLSSLGFHQLIATNSQDYQEIAVSLGASKNYLNESRFLLQERVKQEIMGGTYGPDFLEKILS
jgi:predicted O-linked N-acetylglucosamine transferase (SPINDLY family)